MNTDFIKGIIVPILTPVDKNEVIDEGKMRKQVDFVIDGGVSGILAFGSNGEFYMTEEDEMMKALKSCLIMLPAEYLFIWESAQSAQKSVSALQKQRQQLVQTVYRSFSPCF